MTIITMEAAMVLAPRKQCKCYYSNGLSWQNKTCAMDAMQVCPTYPNHAIIAMQFQGVLGNIKWNKTTLICVTMLRFTHINLITKIDGARPQVLEQIRKETICTLGHLSCHYLFYVNIIM